MSQVHKISDLTKETPEQVIARLTKENAELRAKPRRALSLKVSDKGCISVYGLNAQFPVSLYDEQWDALAAFMGEIAAFKTLHAAEIKSKSDAQRVAKAAAKKAGI